MVSFSVLKIVVPTALLLVHNVNGDGVSSSGENEVINPVPNPGQMPRKDQLKSTQSVSYYFDHGRDIEKPKPGYLDLRREKLKRKFGIDNDADYEKICRWIYDEDLVKIDADPKVKADPLFERSEVDPKIKADPLYKKYLGILALSNKHHKKRIKADKSEERMWRFAAKGRAASIEPSFPADHHKRLLKGNIMSGEELTKSDEKEEDQWSPIRPINQQNIDEFNDKYSSDNAVKPKNFRSNKRFQFPQYLEETWQIAYKIRDVFLDKGLAAGGDPELRLCQYSYPAKSYNLEEFLRNDGSSLDSLKHSSGVRTTHFYRDGSFLTVEMKHRLTEYTRIVKCYVIYVSSSTKKSEARIVIEDDKHTLDSLNPQAICKERSHYTDRVGRGPVKAAFERLQVFKQHMALDEHLQAKQERQSAYDKLCDLIDEKRRLLKYKQRMNDRWLGIWDKLYKQNDTAIKNLMRTYSEHDETIDGIADEKLEEREVVIPAVRCWRICDEVEIEITDRDVGKYVFVYVDCEKHVYIVRKDHFYSRFEVTHTGQRNRIKRSIEEQIYDRKSLTDQEEKVDVSSKTELNNYYGNLKKTLEDLLQKYETYPKQNDRDQSKQLGNLGKCTTKIFDQLVKGTMNTSIDHIDTNNVFIQEERPGKKYKPVYECTHAEFCQMYIRARIERDISAIYEQERHATVHTDIGLEDFLKQSGEEIEPMIEKKVAALKQLLNTYTTRLVDAGLHGLSTVTEEPAQEPTTACMGCGGGNYI